jgi:hypothetical protein
MFLAPICRHEKEILETTPLSIMRRMGKHIAMQAYIKMLYTSEK